MEATSENVIEQQPECPDNKEDTVDSKPTATSTNQSSIQMKQDNLNNTLKDIISTIDSNIVAEENIAALKQRELELIKKQQELAKEIQQQQLLAQKLATENDIKQQQINNKRIGENNENFIPQQHTYRPMENISKYSTCEENQNDNTYTRRSETFESRESTNVSKKIDLHKIFTPATDAEEILPKNRKLYASSAFYSPTLHPTVEDQVELARRISHSLSDISNQQSRGQSMYVNRKKRSVKWVHEGCGQEESLKASRESLNESESINEESTNNSSHLDKVPLKFLMNPCGKMRDINSLRESINTETGLLSPDVSVEVMMALQTQKGKGAELFAKRRKISEKWVVDENNIGAQSPSGLLDYQQNYQQSKPPTSPSILPAYTDAAKHRVQLNLHQDQLLEKYAKPSLKVVQTPWEAALNSGSASAAFVEEQKPSAYPNSSFTRSPTHQLYDGSQGLTHHINLSTGTDYNDKSPIRDGHYKNQSPTNYQLPQTQPERQQYHHTNSQRELAYKPSIPQGWKAPSMSLPKDLYMPKEIPIQSYAPPPVTSIPPSVTPYSSNVDYDFKTSSAPKTFNTAAPAPYFVSDSPSDTKEPLNGGSTFPISKPYTQGFSSTYGSTQPLKQQYLPPQSYQTVPQNSSQNVPQVSFNPSPLAYDKLAKFENPPTGDGRNFRSPSRNYQLNVKASKVRNTSPTPFTGLHQRPCTPSFEAHNYGGASSISPRPASSFGCSSPNSTHTNISSNQILNAPTYNSSARGWGCSAGYQSSRNQISSPSKCLNIVNAASVPYTDF